MRVVWQWFTSPHTVGLTVNAALSLLTYPITLILLCLKHTGPAPGTGTLHCLFTLRETVFCRKPYGLPSPCFRYHLLCWLSPATLPNSLQPLLSFPHPLSCFVLSHNMYPCVLSCLWISSFITIIQCDAASRGWGFCSLLNPQYLVHCLMHSECSIKICGMNEWKPVSSILVD